MALSGNDRRLRRIAGLDILPVKPYQGWNDLQLDEALRRPELFRGNQKLYAAVRREAIKRGLGEEEDFLPFSPTDTDEKEGLPFLLRDPAAKHRRKERKQRLKKLLMETTNPKKDAALGRLLRLADKSVDENLDRQINLYLRRRAGSDKDMGAPPKWKRNMDCSTEEGSPYFGSVEEFMERFPGGIADWREWRKKEARKQRIAALMPKDKVEDLLSEAWEKDAHFVPEGGDDVSELGDKEPKIWSDDPKWKSIGEFLEVHREHFGQDADDAALKAARDFVKYWKLTTRKPKVEK